jgi:hypothetical protein
MAFLAVAATLMAVRGPDLTRIEGAVWILIAFGLFFAEMHFVGAEMKSHDAEQAELRTTPRKRSLSVTSRHYVTPLDVLNRCPDALLRQIAAPEVALLRRVR